MERVLLLRKLLAGLHYEYVEKAHEVSVFANKIYEEIEDTIKVIPGSVLKRAILELTRREKGILTTKEEKKIKDVKEVSSKLHRALEKTYLTKLQLLKERIYKNEKDKIKKKLRSFKNKKKRKKYIFERIAGYTKKLALFVPKTGESITAGCSASKTSTCPVSWSFPARSSSAF